MSHQPTRIDLPISVGEIVYVTLLGTVLPFVVIKIECTREDPIVHSQHGSNLYYLFEPAAIGTNVFLTRTDAQAHLNCHQ